MLSESDLMCVNVNTNRGVARKQDRKELMRF